MPKSFGLLYTLDAYGVEPSLCDSMEVAYRFLEELIDRIDMQLAGNIVVIHGPRKYGVELYPDKAGLTCFAPLITSSITLHTCAEHGFISLDVYSCKDFNQDTVYQFAKETYKFATGEENCFTRGKNYE